MLLFPFELVAVLLFAFFMCLVHVFVRGLQHPRKKDK